ncbi:MAG: pantoate--beta-alanine ligase [Prolixibacteraceae bacterium]|nr:pantoate--beta-alanine ligase [Prolixibacteraceae bacterium]
MELVHTVAALKEAITTQKKQDKTVGFVPTMGALHEGHLSLVRQAGDACSFVVVSIFVNPNQFNNKEDLERYPRNLDADLAMLKTTPCDLVFAPTVSEMYPTEDHRVFDFGHLDVVMEGLHRPGHFNGVAQVVSRLFNMVEPHKAFFGLKDFQQLAIVNQMVKQLKMPVEIVPCPIVREPDGLAMSSRNTLLNSTQRASATLISQTLFAAMQKARHLSVEALKQWVVDNIDQNPDLQTEYFDIVEDQHLNSITSWTDAGNKIGCIAVHCGKVRLIDNVTF